MGERKKCIEEFAEGFAILAKYDDDGFGTCAEHDKVFVTVSRSPSAEDQATLEALDWHINEGDPCWWRKDP